MKTTTLKIASLALIFLAHHNLPAQEQQTSSSAFRQELAKKIAAPPLVASALDSGERKFQANCSRCHTAPEQLSPRIVGTVVRHMRVRASLSAQDEQDILRYLAP
jgi:cytochrome c5